jgi:two-component system, LytTR family, sensor kinase
MLVSTYHCRQLSDLSMLILKQSIDKMPPQKRAVLVSSLLTLALWILCLLMVWYGNPFRETLVFFSLYVPFAFYFFILSYFRHIPKANSSRRPFLSYLWRSALVLILAFIPFTIVTLLFLNDADVSITYAVLNCIFQFMIVLPLTWYIHLHLGKREATIVHLQKELGQSAASLDFLHSQINPHFLFNALNTLYGMALQEGAERTSDGIQRLADMMRFMLQENIQEKIPLEKELNYLDSYIQLQKLRTASHPLIQIQTFISPRETDLEIAPMLLIPFIENAFKHGISFRETSYIKLTLTIEEGILYFDVSNSVHSRKGQDPEKQHTGIGLANVKQRLQLLYPHKHELSIRASAIDFFVHLTLQLDA